MKTVKDRGHSLHQAFTYDLFFRFEATLELVSIGIAPEGLRMANSYAGSGLAEPGIRTAS